MKQEIISYMSTLKDMTWDISKFIYDNPEKDYEESKCSNYLCDIFNNLGFNVVKSYLEIPNAFMATIGNNNPKVCFICQFGTQQKSHIHGVNLVSAISVASAAGLSKVINKVGGSIVVLGCSGALTCDCIVTMFKQGALEDIDFILISHPSTVNAVSISSPEIFPYESFTSNPTITRLFSHNLKENGVIDVVENYPIKTGTGLGLVSHQIPTMYSLISIVQDKSITYSSEEFSRCTLTDFSQNKIMKAAQALSITALDLFEKEELLMESKGNIL